MQYKIRRVNPPARDAIEHGLFGKGGAQKGSTWDDHLYIARQKVGDGWRYFYSQAELRAAQAKQAGGQLKRNATVAAKSGVASAKRVVKNAPNNIRSGISSAKNAIRSTPGNIRTAASSAKTRAENTINSVRSAASDTAAKTKNVLSGQYAKDIDNRIDQIAKDGYDENGHKTMTINGEDVEEYRDLSNKRNKSLTYKISDGVNKSLNAVKDASDKGKAFLDNAVGKAKNTDAYDKAREAATKAADKAQAAADKAMKAAERAREIASKALDNAKNASSDVVNRTKDIGGKAADRIEETAKDVQRYGSNVANTAKDLGSDAYNKAKNTATDISNRAQEGLWEARRNVEEFADKAKNFATNKAYRNDKTYREMVNGVSSMKQDLKSVNAYIDELMDNGTTTPEARQELRDNIELRRQIEDSLDYVQNEIDDYEKRNK